MKWTVHIFQVSLPNIVVELVDKYYVSAEELAEKVEEVTTKFKEQHDLNKENDQF